VGGLEGGLDTIAILLDRILGYSEFKLHAHGVGFGFRIIIISRN
jgi:hypothetical protein